MKTLQNKGRTQTAPAAVTHVQRLSTILSLPSFRLSSGSEADSVRRKNSIYLLAERSRISHTVWVQDPSISKFHNKSVSSVESHFRDLVFHNDFSKKHQFPFFFFFSNGTRRMGCRMAPLFLGLTKSPQTYETLLRHISILSFIQFILLCKDRLQCI